jgi:hypothetical protein
MDGAEGASSPYLAFFCPEIAHGAGGAVRVACPAPPPTHASRVFTYITLLVLAALGTLAAAACDPARRRRRRHSLAAFSFLHVRLARFHLRRATRAYYACRFLCRILHSADGTATPASFTLRLFSSSLRVPCAPSSLLILRLFLPRVPHSRELCTAPETPSGLDSPRRVTSAASVDLGIGRPHLPLRHTAHRAWRPITSSAHLAAVTHAAVFARSRANVATTHSWEVAYSNAHYSATLTCATCSRMSSLSLA